MTTQPDLRPLGAILYIVAAFLTFGHVFNATFEPLQDCGAMPDLHDEKWDAFWECRLDNIVVEAYFGAGIPAVVSGIAWPVYWAGSIAIKVTK